MCPYIYIFATPIPSYGIFMALGICLATTLAVIRAKHVGIRWDNIIIIIGTCIGGALFGSKLLYLLASYGIKQIWLDITNRNFSFISNGGLVFYGGLIGGLAFFPLGMLFSEEWKTQLLSYIIVPCIPLGHAFGRIGCLLAGCCYGLPYSGFAALDLSSVGIPYLVFPIQIIEAYSNFLLSGFLIFLSKKNLPGLFLLNIYIICYSMQRFFIEFFRGDLIRGVVLGLSTSQWISCFLFTVAIAALFIQENTHRKNA